MLILFAMQMAMNHQMPMTDTRIDVSQSRETLTEIPAKHHRMLIDVPTLAQGTIAYCERTGQTRCENRVSAQSGGTAVVVCKIKGAWVVNKCPAVRRK